MQVVEGEREAKVTITTWLGTHCNDKVDRKMSSFARGGNNSRRRALDSCGGDRILCLREESP